MLFSTDPVPAKSKTKCLFFSRDRVSGQVAKVTLNGDLLPWVSTAKHLGNHLSTKLNSSFYSPESKTDLLCKRAIMYDKVHQIIQQYGYLEPQLVVNLLSVYSTALYGSNLWQINSQEFFMLTRSWNTATKIIWDLPYATHTRFLESFSPVPHLESVLTGRYIGFIETLSSSYQPVLSILFKVCRDNCSSQTGNNIKYLMTTHEKFSMADLIGEKQVLRKKRIYTLPEAEEWKVKLIKEIALIKKEYLEVEFDEQDLDDILELLCQD